MQATGRDTTISVNAEPVGKVLSGTVSLDGDGEDVRTIEVPQCPRHPDAEQRRNETQVRCGRCGKFLGLRL